MRIQALSSRYCDYGACVKGSERSNKGRECREWEFTETAAPRSVVQRLPALYDVDIVRVALHARTCCVNTRTACYRRVVSCSFISPLLLVDMVRDVHQQSSLCDPVGQHPPRLGSRHRAARFFADLAGSYQVAYFTAAATETPFLPSSSRDLAAVRQHIALHDFTKAPL